MRRALLAALLPMFAACDHTFYLPRRELTQLPTELGLACAEAFVPVGAGDRLHVWHLAPAGEAQAPVVVHFHGNFANMSAHLGATAWLTRQGYRVVMFDYRGYGRSSGRASRAATVEDGRAVLRAVLDDPRYRGAPLVVFGQSLGGAVALPAVAAERARLGARLQGVVVEGSFARYRDVARAKIRGYPLGGLLAPPLGWLLISSGHEPDEAARALDVPTLFVHATDDPIVPFACGEALAAAAGSGDVRRLWVVSDEHLGAFAGEFPEHRRALLRFLSGS